jgi:hypothetical protein
MKSAQKSEWKTEADGQEKERERLHLLPRFQELCRIKHKVASGEESDVCRHELPKVYFIHTDRQTIAIGDLVRCQVSGGA